MVRKKHAIRRIEQIYCYCRTCWRKLVFAIEWGEMEGKTMKEIEQVCNEKHANVCLKADVRLHATRTR